MTKLKKWIASATLACLWACGSPEQSTIDQFFRAARTNDPTTLASMSAVGPPVEVESWKVVEVSSRSTEPFALPELLDRFEAATKERDAAVEAGQKYASDQPDVLERIIPKLREGSDYKFRREKEGTFQELKRAVRSETGLATKSVMRQVNVENLDGDVAVTEMLLRLKPRDGDELVEERREKEGTFQELKRAVRSETGLATKSVMRQVNVENLDGDVAVTEMLLRLKPRDGDSCPIGLCFESTNSLSRRAIASSPRVGSSSTSRGQPRRLGPRHPRLPRRVNHPRNRQTPPSPRRLPTTKAPPRASSLPGTSQRTGLESYAASLEFRFSPPRQRSKATR